MALRLFMRTFSSKVKAPHISKHSSQRKSPAPKNQKQGDPSKKLPVPNKGALHSDLDPPKKVKISIIGAETKAGRIAAFMLKQHCCVQKLYLYGSSMIESMACDLRCIDTSCRVEGYEGDDNLNHAIRAADIVIIMDVDSKDTDLNKKIGVSAPRVIRLAEKIALHCPRAVVLVCVEPVCCTVPLMKYILADTPWYHPSKLIGCIAPLQTKVNAFAGHYLNLDPHCVHVPIIGGPCAASMVPLISLMTPDPGLYGSDFESFFEYLKSENMKVMRDVKQQKATMDEGFSIARLALTAARGLCGHADALATAFIRSNVIPGVKYLTSTVRFGEGGVVDNYGVPKITRYELSHLEDALHHLQIREKHVSDYIEASIKSGSKRFAAVC